MTITIYGIKNCDTMKKATAWLAEHGVAHDFHDYRKQGVSRESLERWCARLGWETLVNRRGTTWRKLDPSRQAVSSTDDAIALMADQPSLIRRPVVELPSGELLVGFDPDRYRALLTSSENRP